MLTKSINPALASSNGVNTDLEISEPGFDTAVVKKAEKAGPDRFWVLDSLQYSYSSDVLLDLPLKGRIVIKDGEKVIFDVDIPENLSGDFHLYLPASPGNDLEIRLVTAGEGVIGKLNTQCHIEG